jgi:tetratricopeptide (TPR) repeat protein
MSFRLRSRGTLLVLILAAAARGQTLSNPPLIGNYNEAQESQRSGKLSEAADQYRAFLAHALGTLATEYSYARDYAQAAPLFDEALALEPHSASLLLDYARAALTLGDSEHARTLATEFIRNEPGDRVQLAQAHQVLGRALLRLNQDQEARKQLETALALDPTFANGYDLAVACLDLNDEPCAVQIFNEMEASFGDTAEIHLAFGRAYSESDFQPRAITELRHAIQENPRLPGAHYLLAAMLLASASGDSVVTEAEAALKQEALISPRDSTTYTALGKIALNRDNYGEAETYLKEAALLGPTAPDAYLYLGQMYFETNRITEAEAALRECIRLTTDSSRNRYQVQKAHFLLGRILMKKGQEESAHAEMLTARELANKTLAQDKNKLAALMDTAAPGADGEAAAIAGSTDAIALRNANALREHLRLPLADSYNNLGAIEASSSHYASAVRYFERAAVWSPSLEGLDYNWGRAAFAGSEFAEALPPLSRYVKAHPEDAGARSVLGISRYMTGDYAGCLQALQSVVGTPDMAPQVEYVYAESLVKTGNVDSGIQRLTALKQQHPEIADVHRSLGEALEMRGEKAQAKDELEAAIHLNAQDPATHYDLGKLGLTSGDSAGAISELEAAVRLSPTNAAFHEELAKAYTAATRPADAQKQMEICNTLRAQPTKDTALQ